MTTSIHHKVSAIVTALAPSRAEPKTRNPLTIVARPIGIVPMNIETTLCPKIRRASRGNIAHRAE